MRLLSAFNATPPPRFGSTFICTSSPRRKQHRENPNPMNTRCPPAAGTIRLDASTSLVIEPIGLPQRVFGYQLGRLPPRCGCTPCSFLLNNSGVGEDGPLIPLASVHRAGSSQGSSSQYGKKVHFSGPPPLTGQQVRSAGGLVPSGKCRAGRITPPAPRAAGTGDPTTARSASRRRSSGASARAGNGSRPGPVAGPD